VRKTNVFAAADPEAVTAVSRFTTARSALRSTGSIESSTLSGFAASFPARTPSKWTSPAKASDTGFPAALVAAPVPACAESPRPTSAPPRTTTATTRAATASATALSRSDGTVR
jgi:hypothetical protein